MDDARTKLMAQLSRIAPTLSEEQKAERVEWLLETARQPRSADGPIIRVSVSPIEASGTRVGSTEPTSGRGSSRLESSRSL